MSEIRVYPGLIIDGDKDKVIFTLTRIIGETREDYEHRCHEVFKLAVSLVVPSSPTFEVGDTSKYRKVGEHAYEIITPGYAPQEEAVSERDTHFQGFAKLLMQEIDEQVGAVTQWGLEHDIDSQERIGQELYSRWQTIIARRAYDLACHTLYETSYGLDRFYIPERINENVPDLTEWPK